MSVFEHIHRQRNKQQPDPKVKVWNWSRRKGMGPVHRKEFEEPVTHQEAKDQLREELGLSENDELYVWTLVYY